MPPGKIMAAAGQGILSRAAGEVRPHAAPAPRSGLPRALQAAPPRAAVDAALEAWMCTDGRRRQQSSHM